MTTLDTFGIAEMTAELMQAAFTLRGAVKLTFHYFFRATQ